MSIEKIEKCVLVRSYTSYGEIMNADGEEEQQDGNYETGKLKKDLYKDGTIAELLAWIRHDYERGVLTEFDLGRRCDAVLDRTINLEAKIGILYHDIGQLKIP